MICTHKPFLLKIRAKKKRFRLSRCLTPSAVVGALTLHTGVRNRRMELTGKKNARYVVAGFPPAEYVRHHKYNDIFTKNKYHGTN